MSKLKNFLLNRISIVIWDVEIYHKDYIEDGLSQHVYFLTHRAARKFVDQVNASEKYITHGYGGITLWLTNHKFEFPED